MLWTVIEWSLALFLGSICVIGVLTTIDMARDIIKGWRK